jgi:hypothetical protein
MAPVIGDQRTTTAIGLVDSIEQLRDLSALIAALRR